MDEKKIVREFALIFDQKGGIAEKHEKDDKILKCKDCCFWQHLDYTDPTVAPLLVKDYGIDQTIVEALCDEDTRPRCFSTENGLVMILRGINLNKGSDPDDMVSLRFWMDGKKLISLSHRKIFAIQDIYDKLEAGKGPKNTTECLLLITTRLNDIIADFASDISDQADEIEDDIIDVHDNSSNFLLRRKLGEVRHQIIGIRRYIGPQKEIFLNLQNDKSNLLNKKDKNTIREISNTLMKAIEDLDYAKDHLLISHEELQSKLSMNMSRIMYMISIVTAIFIPLGVLTGLLGINVRGIPYAESEYAFGAVCIILIVICAIWIFILRKIHWI